jgi:hypothetical protein
LPSWLAAQVAAAAARLVAEALAPEGLRRPHFRVLSALADADRRELRRLLTRLVEHHSAGARLL